MTPPPKYAFVFTVAGIQFVLRPGGFVLFGLIAAALDLTFLPLALPGQTPATYHFSAAMMTLLMIATTLVHEAGHAIAYRMQGIWPVRITLRGSGGACAAMVSEDTPGRALIRALAGPAATTLVLLLFFVLWRWPLLPASWRLIAVTLAIFSVCDLLFNTLPVHPRCDGSHALRALLWLLQGRQPQPFAVHYLWRPAILAAAMLMLVKGALATGYLVAGSPPMQLAITAVLALCAVPPIALAWRYTRTALGH